MIVSEMLSYLILGVGLGICGGMLGIGGGLIAIPVLSLLFHMDQLLAQGTALIMVTPNVLIGFLRYRQRNHIDLRQTLKLCLVATVFAWFAAQMASAMPVDKLQKAFAAFLLLLAAYYLWQWFDSRRHPVAPAVLSTRFLPLLGIVSGFMSGIFTVGGGLVVVPALVSLFGFSQTQAQGIALALVVPGALAPWRPGGAVFLRPGRQRGLEYRTAAGAGRDPERILGRRFSAQAARHMAEVCLLHGAYRRGNRDAGGLKIRRQGDRRDPGAAVTAALTLAAPRRQCLSPRSRAPVTAALTLAALRRRCLSPRSRAPVTAALTLAALRRRCLSSRSRAPVTAALTRGTAAAVLILTLTSPGNGGADSRGTAAAVLILTVAEHQ